MIARLLCALGLLVVLCGVTAPVGGTPAVPATEAVDSTDDDRPFAEAGLDQTVPVGAVVYLDAYGSRAATGNLTGYEWRIERPDGTVIVPDCPSCELTQFQPARSGEYAVTLTVEDEAGRRTTDTMYVTVRDRAAPQATLSGPERITLNETAQINLSAQASVGHLQSVEWYVDGEYRRGKFLDTESVEQSLQLSPETVGQHTIAAVVRNDNGTARRLRHDVTVSDPVPFEVALTDAADTVEAGQYWAPAFEVTNTGSVKDTQKISLSIPGRGVVDSRSLTLSAGESQSFDTDDNDLTDPIDGGIYGTPPTLAWYTASPGPGTGAGPDGGRHLTTIQSETDQAKTPVSVLGPAYFEVNVETVSAVDSDTARIVATVRNVGGTKGSQSIEYTITGTTINDALWSPHGVVELSPGEQERVIETRPYSSLSNHGYVRSSDTIDGKRCCDPPGGGGGGGGDDPTPSISLTFDHQPEELHDTHADSVTVSYNGSTYTQLEWLGFNIGDDQPYPYESPPSSMTASSQNNGVGTMSIQNDLISGYEAKTETGGETGVIMMGDTKNGLVSTKSFEIAEDELYDGGGGRD